MASVLKDSAELQTSDSFREDAIQSHMPRQSVPQLHIRSRAVQTVGELAERAGLDREPVVLKWQELIRTAVSEQYQESQPERWDQRRSVSLLTLMSLLFWGAILAAAFGLL